MEMISAKLKQHILAAKQNWETVKKSKDLPEEIVRLIEKRGKDAPFVSQGADFGIPGDAPPIVRRGFPLGNGDWAVSSFRDIGASLTRERGNYLVHTLVVPAEIVRELRYNIPWIAYQLAQQVTEPMRKRPSEIYDLHSKGAEEMEDAEVVLNPKGQFRALVFMAEEMGMTELNALLQRFLTQAGSGGPFDLAMSAPNVEKVVEASKNHLNGIEAEGKIPGDRVRVLRLAGLFSILPDTLKLALPYAINQPKPLAQARRGEELDYRIRIPREPLSARESSRQPATPVIDQEAWPWLDHCVRLAKDNTLLGDQQLIMLTDWFTSLLSNNESAPSSNDIDAGFAFWCQYSGVERDHRPALPPLSVFEGARVNIDFLFNETFPLIANSDWKTRFEYCFHLCNIADKSVIGLPLAAFKEVVACFSYLCALGDMGKLREFCTILPKSLYSQLWEQSYRDGLPPGRMRPSGDTRIDKILLRFALATFDPGQITSTETSNRIIEQIRDALTGWRCSPPKRDLRSGYLNAPTDSARQRWAMLELVTVDEVNSTVLESLIQDYLSALPKPRMEINYNYQIYNEKFPSDASSQLARLLEEATRWKLGDIGAPVLAQTLNSVRKRRDLDGFHALLDIRLEMAMLTNLIQVLDRLDAWFVDHTSQQSLTAMASKLVREIATVTQDASLLESFGSHNAVLPVFRNWVDNPRTQDWQISTVIQLIRSVLSSATNQPETVVAVASTYLRYCPKIFDSRLLFDIVDHVFDHDTKKIRAWLEQNPVRSRYLVRFLCSSANYGGDRAESCWRQIERVVCRLDSPELRQEVRSQFQNNEVFSKLPKTVRKMIEGQWLGPQGAVLPVDRRPF